MESTITNSYELELKIAELPKGSISRKIINGKERFYLQWSENGKTKSKYIPNEKVQDYRLMISERKILEDLLEKTKSKEQNLKSMVSYIKYVTAGEKLRNYCMSSSKFKKREIFDVLDKFIKGPYQEKVCVLYGLRRTGKTTLIRQSILSLTEEDFNKTAFIKVNEKFTMDDLNDILEKLEMLGYKYIYIDEITLIKDFIDGASLLSDIYTPSGMKIILSGTDSLGFWLANYNELYDRCIMIHTTYIPFREHSKLLEIDSVDEYIKYGGTLKAGSWDFDSKDYNIEDASFRDNESTRFYIDSAISHNIQHSLAHYEGGEHFRHLKELYDKDELTSAINRIVEDMNHKFVIDVITRDFISNDLHILNSNIKRDKNYRFLKILDEVNENDITNRFIELLNIKNKENQHVEITEQHVYEIKEYLRALDLISEIDIRTLGFDKDYSKYIIFTQPGMRYSLTKALVFSMLKDQSFLDLGSELCDMIVTRLLDEIEGRMLEDIVLLDTKLKLGKEKDVFKLQFSNGEYDMVIWNMKEKSCELYEIKHSNKVVKHQARHLLDEEKLSLTEFTFGKITRRCVLYNGNNLITDDGIEYKNVNEFLLEE